MFPPGDVLEPFFNEKCPLLPCRNIYACLRYHMSLIHTRKLSLATDCDPARDIGSSPSFGASILVLRLLGIRQR